MTTVGHQSPSTPRSSDVKRRKEQQPTQTGQPEMPQSVQDIVGSPGRPLDAKTRTYFERQFASDFGHVRIHDGARAARSASELEALSYTSGRSIVFRPGWYAPETRVGRSLLAHELTHVVQQDAGSDRVEPHRVESPNSHNESEARAAERGRVAPAARSAPRALPGLVQRRSLWEGIAGLFRGDDFIGEELVTYLETLDRTGTIEDYTESDNKARAVVGRWVRGDSLFLLGPSRKILLIQEMLSGFTGDADEQAILQILRGTGAAEFDAVLAAVGEGSLNSGFQGSEQDDLDALLSARQGRNSARVPGGAGGEQASDPAGPGGADSEVFSPEMVVELQQRFTSNAELTNRLNCIEIIRQVAPELFSGNPQLAERVRDRLGDLRGQTLTMTQLGRAMSELGLSSASRRLRFNNGNGNRQPTAMEASAWETIMEMVGGTPGWHIFGLAVFDGYHSVTVLVDNRPDGPRLYWADQWRIDPGDDFHEEQGSASGFRRYEQAGFDRFLTEYTVSRWQTVFEEKQKRFNATLHIWKFRSALEGQAPGTGTPDGSEPSMQRKVAEGTGSGAIAGGVAAPAFERSPSSGQPPDQSLLARVLPFLRSGDVNTPGREQQERGARAVEQRAMTGSGGNPEAPPGGIDGPLDPSRFEDVRLHTDGLAARAANAANAAAYTSGTHITFARGQFEPETQRGRALLAHELTHVAQQRRGDPGAPQRRVMDGYEAIEDRLSYGLFDWAITDREARDVLGLLAGLSDRELADTVAAMDRDGLVERLLDNISADDYERHAVLIARVVRRRSVRRSAARVEDRLTYGVFDWAITDRDAEDALHTLMGLESQQLRTMVGRMVNDGTFDRLMENLPQSAHDRYAAFIERLRRIQIDFNSLVSDHVAYLRSRSGGAGRTIRRRVDRTGYGGSQSTWNDLDDRVKSRWQERARTVIEEVTESLRGTDLEAILIRSELVFKPVETEENNAYAYVHGTNELFFGTSWVEDAEENVRNVWQSIAHELGGHEEFGFTWSWEIMKRTLSQLSPEERAQALGSANRVFSAYGYLETEIYAELRELPYRIGTSGGDTPASDIRGKLRRMHRAFGPDVALQIVMRLYYRVLDDPRVSSDARQLLYDAVQTEFSLFPIKGTVAP